MTFPTYRFLPPSEDVSPNIELIQFASAGVDPIVNHPIFTDSCIPLSTASGIHGPQIAEWVIMTALVHSHKYNKLYELQKKHHWGKEGVEDEFRSVRDKVGQRLGVLGYGSIGRQGEL